MAALRVDNPQLRAENRELRAAAEAEGGSVTDLLAPLLRGEAPSGEELLEFLLPHLGDLLGDR